MPTSLRLISVDARGFGRDHAALAGTIAAAEADVACVHGAPHLLRWRSTVAAIGRRSGLVVVGGGRPAGANVLLSTLGVDVVATQDLGFAGGSKLHPAGAVLAALSRHGTGFVLVAASLDGSPAQHAEQVAQLQAAVGDLVPSSPPAIVSALGIDRGPAQWSALAENRNAVAGRLFVDPRVEVGDVQDADGATVVELAVQG